MKVYVLESGSYEERCIEGIYIMRAEAMAAWEREMAEDRQEREAVAAGSRSDGQWHRYGESVFSDPPSLPSQWESAGPDVWAYGANGWDCATIREYEVQG